MSDNMRDEWHCHEISDEGFLKRSKPGSIGAKRMFLFLGRRSIVLLCLSLRPKTQKKFYLYNIQ